jgi:hypothetical protein
MGCSRIVYSAVAGPGNQFLVDVSGAVTTLTAISGSKRGAKIPQTALPSCVAIRFPSSPTPLVIFGDSCTSRALDLEVPLGQLSSGRGSPACLLDRYKASTRAMV